MTLASRPRERACRGFVRRRCASHRSREWPVLADRIGTSHYGYGPPVDVLVTLEQGFPAGTDAAAR